MKSGWIKLHRKQLKWGWYKHPNTVRLFNHLLITANFEGGFSGPVELKPGQIITGRLKLSNETGLSEQNIKTALKNLELTKDITKQSTPNYTLITITNWYEYQADNRDANQAPTNDQPTTNQELTTIEELKNLRIKEESERAQPKKPKTKKGTRLPDNWEITEEYIQAGLSLNEGWTIEELTNHAGPRFKDYWIAETGAKAVKVDWVATFRNHCRKHYNKPARNKPASGPMQPMAKGFEDAGIEADERAERNAASGQVVSFPGKG